MVNSNPSNDDDFQARALASLRQQISLASASTEGGAHASASASAAAAAAASSTVADVESYAKSLIDDDLPKIDSAVKAYLSLVAARSVVASDIDVLSTAPPPPAAEVSVGVQDGAADATSAYRRNNNVDHYCNDSDGRDLQCTFASSASGRSSSADANRLALSCARTLLGAVNSTIIASSAAASATAGDSGGEGGSSAEGRGKDGDSEDEARRIELRNDAARILWNGLVERSSSMEDKKAKTRTKPSRLLGRDSLRLAYPYIKERLQRGVAVHPKNDGQGDDGGGNDAIKVERRNEPQFESLSNEALPPVPPPSGIDINDWIAFYVEFGNLLCRACRVRDATVPPEEEAVAAGDDSALVWSNDGGAAELRRRREMRARRASEALASAASEAKEAVLDSIAEGGSKK